MTIPPSLAQPSFSQAPIETNRPERDLQDDHGREGRPDLGDRRRHPCEARCRYGRTGAHSPTPPKPPA